MTKRRFCSRSCKKRCNISAKPATPSLSAKPAIWPPIPAQFVLLRNFCGSSVQFSRGTSCPSDTLLQFLPQNLRPAFSAATLVIPASSHHPFCQSCSKTRVKTCKTCMTFTPLTVSSQSCCRFCKPFRRNCKNTDPRHFLSVTHHRVTHEYLPTLWFYELRALT